MTSWKRHKYKDRETISDRSELPMEGLTKKGQYEEIFLGDGLLGLSCIWIVVVVTCLYAFAKIQKMVHQTE